MSISVRHLRKSFGPDAPVVRDVSFQIEPGEMFFLLGPSGCGKTTVLRMLAGFIKPDAGDILFQGQRINDISPQDRNMALVFQNYAIWPHLNVYENVAYGLRARKLDSKTIEARTREALGVVRLDHLAQRKPAQLSGGQQQRVALARALAVRPVLILLDEPLSNLDAGLRIELREELRRIHSETQSTCLYVTHDQAEALSLADRIGVMNEGQIEQIASPYEIYRQPRTKFVGQFLGGLNLLEGDGPSARQLEAPAGAQVAFRPEAAVLAETGIGATVRTASFQGGWTELTVELATGETCRLHTPFPVKAGETVRFKVPTSEWIVF